MKPTLPDQRATSPATRMRSAEPIIPKYCLRGHWFGMPLIILCVFAGCGTTQYTDTSRSATEQLLLSNAMDQAVNKLDLRALASKKVYVNDEPISNSTDSDYLVSLIRQHTAASGGLICDKEEDADYILEIRSGAVGTDRHDLLYGIPAVQVPAPLAMMGTGGTIPQIPEIPFIKKTKQTGVVKLSLFAYNRRTGSAIWQSGNVPSESKAKSLWVFGAGPFQKGNIFEGTNFAGQKILPDIALVDLRKGKQSNNQLELTREAYFIEPKSEEEKTRLASSESPRKDSQKTPPRPQKSSADSPPEKKAEPNPTNRMARRPKEHAGEEHAEDAVFSNSPPSSNTSSPESQNSLSPLHHPDDINQIDDDHRGRLPVPSQYGPGPTLRTPLSTRRRTTPPSPVNPPAWQVPPSMEGYPPQHYPAGEAVLQTMPSYESSPPEPTHSPSYTPGSTQYAP